MNDELIQQVIQYHERTKHHPYRSARGPGYLDWENQPNPFRRYLGAPLVYLPHITGDESPRFYELFIPDAVAPVSLTPDTLSRFFELSLAISAWKEYQGARWALRCNPSSGNLHPTEGYAVLPSIDGIHAMPGVYHYAPAEHALELRAEFNQWEELVGVDKNVFFIGLTSIHWREAWKYGERAFRYCQHDVGHALAAIRIAAATLGWRISMQNGISDQVISKLLGLDRDVDYLPGEREHPDLICAVFTNQVSEITIDESVVDKIAKGRWFGRADRLSDEVLPWDAIARVSEATLKPTTETGVATVQLQGLPLCTQSAFSARQIIRQRRSATDYDGKTHISAKTFYEILSYTIKTSSVPWDCISWPSQIHLCLYVHRVHGVVPGLYFLVRDCNKVDYLKSIMKPEFHWLKPEGCPSEIGLYLLQEGNLQSLSAQISCTQQIAGQGAFSLGMIAEFATSLATYGAWFYRHLFWETGMIGQMLYLAAEEAGVRGTGIGCYFDDSVHSVLGISDNKLQSLYHFTIGCPVEDKRLTTLPAYPWSK